jgi:hypothetical protein
MSISSSTCSAPARRDRARILDRKARQAEEVRLARQSAGRKTRSAGHARLPHVHDLRVFRHRVADGDLVREERSQHLRHASLHPSADGGGRSGLGSAQRLGDLQGHRQEFSKIAPEVLGVEKDVVLNPIMHDTPGEIAQPFDVKDWKKGEIDPIPGKTMPRSPWSSATIRTSTSSLRRSAR